MVHCNPAPPHPDPGTLSKAVCIDWTMAVMLCTLLLVVIAIVVLSDNKEERDG